MELSTLVDCGAEGRFINKKNIKWSNTKKLREPILVRNIDRTINKAGEVTRKAWIEMGIPWPTGSM
jgi:hypothetical protein